MEIFQKKKGNVALDETFQIILTKIKKKNFYHTEKGKLLCLNF